MHIYLFIYIAGDTGVYKMAFSLSFAGIYFNLWILEHFSEWIYSYSANTSSHALGYKQSKRNTFAELEMSASHVSANTDIRRNTQLNRALNNDQTRPISGSLKVRQFLPLLDDEE